MTDFCSAILLNIVLNSPKEVVEKMITRKNAEAALEKLKNEYASKLPFPNHINGYGISKIGLIDPAAPKEKHDDFCVKVYLIKKLPKTAHLPEEIDGVRIFTKVIGKIIPL